MAIHRSVTLTVGMALLVGVAFGRPAVPSPRPPIVEQPNATAQTTRCQDGKADHPTSPTGAPHSPVTPGRRNLPRQALPRPAAVPARAGFSDFDGDGFPDQAVGVFCKDVESGGGTLVDAGAVEVLYSSSSGLTTANDQFFTEDSVGIPGHGAQALAQFGWAVQCGDFNGDGYADLAIAIPMQDVTVEGITYPQAGAVVVLSGSPAGLTTAGAQYFDQSTQGLVSQGPQDGGGFGRSLSAGDYNGDGYADLAIGGRKEDVGTISQAGNVNVLYGSPNGLTLTGNQLFNENTPGIDAGGAAPGDWFGRFVGSGDMNGDGFDDLVAAIPFKDVQVGPTKLMDAGAFVAIYGSAAGLQTFAPAAQYWTHDTPGVIGGAQAGGHFAHDVSIADFNGDGFADIATGNRDEGVGSAPKAGDVSVIYGSAAGLQTTSPEAQMWTMESVGGLAQAGDHLGRELDAGDFNGDGNADLGIGVPFRDLTRSGRTVTDAGAVLVLYGSASGLQASSPGAQLWTQGSPGVKGNVQGGARFGCGIVGQDFNGDGYADLLVGVRYEDVDAVVDAGQIQILYGGPAGVQASSPDDQVFNENSPGIGTGPAAPHDLFGWGLAGGTGSG